jgi:hypothetical protein
LLAAMHIAIAQVALHDRSRNTEFERACVIALEELNLLRRTSK